MKPFLNWAGGKRWLVSKHPDLLICDGQRFIEPFVGSGAVFFHVGPSKALLSDRNGDLIDLYVTMRDEPDKIRAALRRHHMAHSEDHYYKVRTSRPRTQTGRAARLIYLNRTCFNGLYRVNLRGEFNVPIGSKKSVLLPDDDFEGWAMKLRGVELAAQDFAVSLGKAGSGDFVYVDPPYTVKHNMNNFVKYNEHIFSWDDQLRLQECLVGATLRGASVVMSNADHPSVRNLYSGKGWSHLTLSRQSRLAASASHRAIATEIVVSNCLTKQGKRVSPRPCA